MDTPPLRLAADPTHPWYDNRWVWRARVFLDGHELHRVTVVDAVEGWAEMHLDPPVIVDGRMQTIRVKGSIQIVPKDGAP